MISENCAKLYCCEDISKIENYDKAIADKTQMWKCHHRLEVQGDKLISKDKLIAMNQYWNRPASELIFVTGSQHNKIHNAVCAKGGKNAAKNLNEKLTFEWRSKKNKGRKWWNNGSQNRFCKECPEGFVPGRLTKK